jgi:Flp pilus assembly protein protease CpaA
MKLWLIVLIWQAYQDWQTLTVHLIGNIALFVISLCFGSFERMPLALIIYIFLHLLNFNKHLKGSMGEGDRQLLAISAIIHPWNSWCHILWLSQIPFFLIKRTQHPFYAYYGISSILYYFFN